MKAYLKKLWSKLQEDLKSIVTFLATVYFLLDISGIINISELKDFFKIIILSVIVGLAVYAVITAIRDGVKYLTDKMAEYLSDIKEIKKMKKEIQQLKKEVNILKRKVK